MKIKAKIEKLLAKAEGTDALAMLSMVAFGGLGGYLLAAWFGFTG